MGFPMTSCGGRGYLLDQKRKAALVLLSHHTAHWSVYGVKGFRRHQIVILFPAFVPRSFLFVIIFLTGKPGQRQAIELLNRQAAKPPTMSMFSGKAGSGSAGKPTTAKSVSGYLHAIAEPRRTEIKKLDALIRKAVPKLKPFLIAGMIGYGKYHYKYASGREGDWAIIALASQKNYISVYVCSVKNGKYVAESNKHLFPKASIGRSCIRFKKTDDIDLQNLKNVIIQGARSPFGM